MTINSATYLKSLHELLFEHFSLEEIRTLCFSLHVDYESISGAEKQVVIRELLLGLGRNGRLPDLISLAQQQRPLISCPPMPDDFTLPKSLAGDNRDMPVTNYSYYGDVVHGDKVEGDQVAGRKIEAQFYIEKQEVHQTGTTSEVHQLLTQYRQEVQQQYLAFWQKHVEETLSAPDYLPQPIGQIFYAEWFQKLQNEIAAKEYKANQKKEPDRVKESEATKDEKDGETNPSLTKSVTFFPDKTLSSLHAIFLLLHHPQNKQPTTSGLVLTGEPGAGKTVALRHLAATYAMQSAEPDSPIPIYLPLNQYDGQESISAFISSSLSEKHLPLSFSQLAKRLEDILPHHRWLLLLDGFNEIGESRQDTIRHRQAFLRTLQTFVRDYQVEVVISSRENAIPDIKDFQIVNLRPLDQLGIEQCLYLYAPEYAPAILQELEKQPSLRHMVANPFRAKAIAQIYRPNSNLPTTPVSLFAQLTSHLVHRETTRCQTIDSYFPPIEIWQNTVLQTAVSMHRNHTTTSTLPTSGEEQKHLAFAAQCGLLLSRTNQVEFIHHQLQEYFAALWLKAEILEENLKNEHLDAIWQDSYWDETVLLLCSLLSEQNLSKLITLLAKHDPYLAARSVGQSPERVFSAIRSWLANHLRGAYDRVVGQERVNIINALGAMRCEEGFLQLVSLTKDGHSHDNETFLTAVAQYDTDAAARFIGEQLYAAVQRDWENRWHSRETDYTIFTRALGRMKTPYARAFLIHAVQDRKLTAAALTGIAKGRFHEAIPVLREALDSSEFEAVCETVGEAQFTPLIPDLIPYAEYHPVAMTALLRMNAGQALIDHAAYFYQDLTRQYQFQVDLHLLGGINQRYYDELTYYLFLEHYFHPELVEGFLDILVWIAEHSSDLDSRASALAVLLFVRHPQLPSLVQRLNVQKDDHAEHDYIQIVNAANMLLTLPLQAGFSADPLIRFVLRLDRLEEWAISIGIPAKLDTLLQAIALDRKQVGEWAFAYLIQQAGPTKNLQRVLEAMSVLVELGWPDMAPRLTVAVTECINVWESGQNKLYDLRNIAWQYVPLFVSYGEQNEVQRRQILQMVAPQVHQPGYLWPLIAIEICTLLQSIDHIYEWLRYLRNSTWRKAYAIVDALGRLDVPPAVVTKLTQKLTSPLADERFFAVLSLGEMRETAALPYLLALKQEPDRHVQWAIVWAIGHIGVMTSVVIDSLRTATTWNNGRARMEVAHAIGQNQCKELSYLLHQMLNDPDLRVVERTVWSLGILRDTSSVASLSTMLNKAKHGGKMYADNYHYRVEERLQQTLTTALVCIKQGVDVQTITEEIPKNLGAICAGLIQTEKVKHTVFVDTQPLMPVITAQETVNQAISIEGLTGEDLIRQIYNADTPQARLRALETSIAEKEFLSSDISSSRDDNIERAKYDPNNTIRIRARQHTGYRRPSTIEFSLQHIPESLAFGNKRIQGQVVESTLAIFPVRPDRWSSLKLAHYFATEFDIKELHNAALAQYRWGQLGKDEFVFLADTLPEIHLAKLVLLWRQTTENPESRWSGWYSDSPTTLTPLAKRRKWNIVPDLMHILCGETPAALDAAFGLIEMGIYQASAPITKAMQTLTKWSGEKEIGQPLRAYIQAVAQVELSGATSHVISPELLLGKEDYSPRDSAFYDHLGDLLCEIDSPQPPDEWAQVQKLVLRNDYGDNDRYDAIKRGLRKWGSAALTQFFELDDESFTNRYLRYTRDLVYKETAHVHNIFFQSAKEMMEDRLAYHDELFLPWLTHTHLPLQLFGLYTLASRHTPIPIETLTRLFTQANEILVVELIRHAARIPTLQSILQAMGKESPSFTTEIEANIAEQIAHRIVEQIQVGDPQVLELLSTYRLPQFDSHILKMLRSDNSELNNEFIKAAVEIDALSGNKALRHGLLSLLQSDDTSIVGIVMVYLLQTENEELGTHLALSLKQAKEGGNTEKLILSMLGIVLAAYDGATQDVITLLRHPDDAVRLTAVGTCAALNLTSALPQLQESTAILIQQIGTHQEIDDGKESDRLTDNITNLQQASHPFIEPLEENFRLSPPLQKASTINAAFISREPDSELAAVQFTRAILGDSIPFTVGDMSYEQLGEGLVGFWECALSAEGQLRHYPARHYFVGPRLLSPPLPEHKDFNWLFSVPYVWQRFVSIDLEKVSWLNPADRQVLLASMPLILFQFYADMNRENSLFRLPQPEEAIHEFCQKLGVENQKEQVIEQLAKTVQHLLNDLVKHLAKSSILLTDTPSAFSSIEELFLLNEDGIVSWQMIQESLQKITGTVYAFLAADKPPHPPANFDQLASLPLLGEQVSDLWLEIVEGATLTGTPDLDFFTDLKAFGQDTWIYAAICRWGCVMVELLRKNYDDAQLGSSYLDYWAMRLSAIFPEFQYKEDRPNENGRYQKQNPLAFMFEPFRQT